MNLTLKRQEYSKDGIFGQLTDGHGVTLSFTIEHSYDGKPKLPAGTYICVRGIHSLSDGKPFETFEVKDVPGHTGILFHCGNTQADSSGCILVGSRRVGSMVTQSRVAFDNFMGIQARSNSFILVVK